MYSENIQQIYRRAPILKCDFNKAETLLKSPFRMVVNLLHIFRTPFSKNTSGRSSSMRNITFFKKSIFLICQLDKKCNRFYQFMFWHFVISQIMLLHSTMLLISFTLSIYFLWARSTEIIIVNYFCVRHKNWQRHNLHFKLLCSKENLWKSKFTYHYHPSL